jgi:hypothetical protein
LLKLCRKLSIQKRFCKFNVKYSLHHFNYVKQCPNRIKDHTKEETWPTTNRSKQKTWYIDLDFVFQYKVTHFHYLSKIFIYRVQCEWLHVSWMCLLANILAMWALENERQFHSNTIIFFVFPLCTIYILPLHRRLHKVM